MRWCFLQKSHLVAAVQLLSENTFDTNYKIKILLCRQFVYTYARLFVPICLANANRLRTDDVVLKQYESDKPIRKSSPCKSLVVKNEILLFGDEFADLNGWNVDMAFSEEDEDIKAFSNSPVKKLRLKGCRNNVIP